MSDSVWRWVWQKYYFSVFKCIILIEHYTEYATLFTSVTSSHAGKDVPEDVCIICICLQTLLCSPWNLPTTPPSRASFEQSGLSLASQSPVASLKRCPHSASFSLTRTRTWSWRSTQTWQWTPVPADNVSCYPFTHQTLPDHLSFLFIPFPFCTGWETTSL